MKKTMALAASIALAAGMTLPGTVAQADDRPVKAGWQWQLPDGSVQGSCADGYRPVWSEVPDFDGAARYWVAYSKRGGWKQTYNLTYAEVQEVIAEDFAPEHKTNPRLWGYMFNNGYETVTTTPQVGKLYEGDCILTTHEIPGGENNGKDDDVKPIPTPEPPKTPNVPVTPPTTPPMQPKPPVVVKPVITKRTVQIDTYRYTTKAERTRIYSMALDGVLKFREDAFAWKTSTWVIAEQTLTNGKVTATKVLKTGGNGAKAKGSKAVMTWQLNKRATVNAPWGSNGKLAQLFLG